MYESRPNSLQKYRNIHDGDKINRKQRRECSINKQQNNINIVCVLTFKVIRFSIECSNDSAEVRRSDLITLLFSVHKSKHTEYTIIAHLAFFETFQSLRFLAFGIFIGLCSI